MKHILSIFVSFLLLFSNCTQQIKKFPKPEVIPGSEWRAHQPVGYTAKGRRINLPPGKSFQYESLELTIKNIQLAKNDNTLKNDIIELDIKMPGQTVKKEVAAGSAFTLLNYRIAILGSHNNPGELGLTEFEICNLSDVPEEIAAQNTAGDVSSRARIIHTIDKITLHHTGDPKAIPYNYNVVKKLQGLQQWGETSKNWFDIPYHFVIAPNGKIYECRDVKYMGETNTEYDPYGHFLITALGNFEIQKPSEEQIESIVNLMVWAVQEYNVPLSEIYGHRDLTPTTVCPGDSLYQLLEDGSLLKRVKEKLK